MNLLLATWLAAAALPPSGYLAKRIVDRRQDLTAVVVQTQADIEGTKLNTQCVGLFKEREIRCQLFSAEGREIYRVVRRTGSKQTPPLAAFLFESDSSAFEALLLRMRVPIRTEHQLLGLKSEKLRRESETVTLRRLDESVVWAMGTEATGELLMERYTFQPLRLTFSSAEAGVVQAKFSKFQTYKGFAFPQEQQLLVAGQPYSERLTRFSPPNAKLLKEAESWSTGPTPELASSGLGTAVETYLRIFR